MLTIQQIDQAIQLVEMHMNDCQVNQDFRQANSVKQKLLQMKSIKDLILKEEIMTTYEQNRERIEAQSRELECQIQQEYKQAMAQIKQQGQAALSQLRLQPLQQSPAKFKKVPNQDYLQFSKIMKYLSNQGDYKRAEIYQIYAKKAEEVSLQKSQLGYTQTTFAYEKNQKDRLQQSISIMEQKYKDYELKLKHQFEQRFEEVRLKKNSLLKIIQQEKTVKLQQLEKTNTKSLKVQIQQQIRDLTPFSMN